MRDLGHKPWPSNRAWRFEGKPSALLPSPPRWALRKIGARWPLLCVGRSALAHPALRRWRQSHGPWSPRRPPARRPDSVVARLRPFLAMPLARARSTRIRRIMFAETAKKCARSCQVTLSTSTSRRKTSWTRAVACKVLPALSLRMYLAAIRRSSRYTLGVSSSKAPWSPPLQAFRRWVTLFDSRLITPVDATNHTCSRQSERIFWARCSSASDFSLTKMKAERSSSGGGEETGISGNGSTHGQPRADPLRSRSPTQTYRRSYEIGA